LKRKLAIEDGPTNCPLEHQRHLPLSLNLSEPLAPTVRTSGGSKPRIQLWVGPQRNLLVSRRTRQRDRPRVSLRMGRRRQRRATKERCCI